MKKVFVVLLTLFFLQACTQTAVNQQSVSPAPERQKSSFSVQQKSSAPVKKAAVSKKAAPKEIYTPKMKAYLDKSPLVSAIRTQLPKQATYAVAENCTLEKFISSINATEINSSQPKNDQIIIETKGAKLGNGQMIFKLKNKEKKAELEKLSVGKINQSDLGVLSGTIKNLCEKADKNAGED